MELTRLMTRVGRVQFIVLCLIGTGFILFGLPFIKLWAGKDYLDSYPITLLLIIPATVPLTQNIGIEIQKAKNMHQFRSWVYILIALANLIISIPLIDRFGGVGGALGTAISLLIGNGVVMNWYYHYRVGLDMGYFWKEVLKCGPAFVFPVIVGLLLKLFLEISEPISFLTAGFIYTVSFILSMWLIGMNHYEKELIARPVTKALRRVRERVIG